MRRNCAICSSGLVGFIVGTVVALGYVTSGASLFFVKEGLFRVLLYPGNFVGYQLFDLVGYSAAMSGACLAVGLAYSALASTVAVVLSKLLSTGPEEAFTVQELRHEEEFV